MLIWLSLLVLAEGVSASAGSSGAVAVGLVTLSIGPSTTAFTTVAPSTTATITVTPS